MKSNNKTCSAFTLLDLLVCVVCITGLGIVALAARPASAHSAALSICLNNLRQITQATHLYSVENADYLPFPNWGSGYLSVGWLYQPTTSGPPQLGSDPVAAYRTGLLWPYTRSISIYRCPTDATNAPRSTWPYRLNQLSTYVMNGAACGFASRNPSWKTTQIAVRDAVLFWEPAPWVTSSYNDAAASPNMSEGPERRHVTGCAIGCLDGHVQFLRYTDAVPLMNSTNNALWWNPGTPNGH